MEMCAAGSLESQRVAAQVQCPLPTVTFPAVTGADRQTQANRWILIQVQISTQIALIELNEGAQPKPQQPLQLHIFS